MVQFLNPLTMTESEIIASMNFVREFEVLQYVVGLATAIVVALAGAIIFMYRDNRTIQEKNADNMAKQNVLLMDVISKNTEAFHRVELSNQRLADVVDRQERTTQNLERLILERLER